MAKSIRVGFVGAGGIVKSRHVPGLKQIADVELVAVANRSEASSKKAAAEMGIAEAMGDWEKLVQRKDLDVIWIGTWPSMHSPVTVAALGAGKHVFCQARMARYLPEGAAMAAAAEKAVGKVTMLCPPPHYLAIDNRVRKMLKDGFCGEIRHVRVASLARGLCDPNSPRSWRLSEADSGVQTLDLGIQAEVVHRWVGLPERVSAEGFIFTPERPDPNDPAKKLPVTTFEQVTVNCRMAGRGGALAPQGPFSLQYTMSGAIPAASPGSAGSLEIYGSKGVILVEPFSTVIRFATAAKPEEWMREDVAQAADKKEWTVEKDFIDAVRAADGRRLEPNFQDGLD
ncbi:MAG TPA: Gfo/Idh/MocA family oxidoreductase, partial [Planctomycetota bacterium]|nr:Gfo/Idh/MocA family oxidoreductase [Planctomycetota bacterium]